MVKKISISLMIITCSLILLLGAAFGWVVSTQSGARWVLNNLPGWVDIDLKIGQIDGTLGGKLQLKEIKLTHAGTNLQLEHLFLDSHVTNLFYPAIQIRELQLTHLIIDFPATTTAEKTTDAHFSWPVLPPILEKLQFEVADFELVDARIMSQQETIMEIDSLQARVVWKDNILQFDLLNFQEKKRPGSIAAQGKLNYSSSPPSFDGHLEFRDLDLQLQTEQPFLLSGTVAITGEVEDYHGEFNLRTRGAEFLTTESTGAFSGDQQQLDFSDMSVHWLSGFINGAGQLAWGDGWRAELQLEGRELNPQLLNDQLDGVINLGIAANFSKQKESVPQGELKLQLHHSVLHGQPLTGKTVLRLDGDSLEIDSLQLLGEGIQVNASGNPAERLEFSWQIEQLQQLSTNLQGDSTGEGWLRWQAGIPTGMVSATGHHLIYQQWDLEYLELQGKSLPTDDSWQLQFTGQNISQTEEILVNVFALNLQGSLTDHQLSLTAQQDDSNLDLHLDGGWDDQRWQGFIDTLRVNDSRLGDWQLEQKTALILAQEVIHVDPFSLQGSNGQIIKLQGDFQPSDSDGSAAIEWQNLDLAPLRYFLSDWQISGYSNGLMRVSKGETDHLEAEITISGTLQQQELILQLTSGDIFLDWKKDNLAGNIDLSFSDGGLVHGKISAEQGDVFSFPSHFNLQLSGRDFPLQLFRPWVPPGMEISGLLNWELDGQKQPSGLMDLRGHANTAAVKLALEEADGLLIADITSSELSLQWNNQLDAQLQISLQEQGAINAELYLPTAARFPLKIEPETDIDAKLMADLTELGLLSLLFPGQIEESRGELKVDLQLSGSLQSPTYQGTFQLFDAGAFLLSLGVELNNVKVDGHITDNKISIIAIELFSGGGQLQGSGELELLNWRPGSYHLELHGDDFQLFNLSELQARIHPDLKISGDVNKIKVRGRIDFPQLFFAGGDSDRAINQSPDLIFVDAEESSHSQSLFIHDIDVQLELGDQVLVKSAGLDAKLEGGIRLYSATHQAFVADGKISVAKGKFSCYGVSLDIERGDIYFTGPVEQPTLDILALRRIDDIEAGVIVGGTPRLPLVQLYSKPFMPDTDILSYIVLGRPIDAAGGESSLLLGAAGALLSRGKSASLQEQMKNQFGLDTLELSSGDGDIHNSVVTTGKYLNPDLYISLGYSLFQNTNEVNVRYSFTPVWQIESSIGSEESGIDLYYKVEMD